MIVSLDMARAHCREPAVEEEASLRQYIKAAQSWIEAHLGRRFVSEATTITRTYPCFPDFDLALKEPGATSVSAVRYRDEADDLVSLSADRWRSVSVEAEVRAIRPAGGVSWPATSAAQDAVEVDVVLEPAEVPPHIVQAALILVETFYSNRSAYAPVPGNVADLLRKEVSLR